MQIATPDVPGELLAAAGRGKNEAKWFESGNG